MFFYIPLIWTFLTWWPQWEPGELQSLLLEAGSHEGSQRAFAMFPRAGHTAQVFPWQTNLQWCELCCAWDLSGDLKPFPADQLCQELSAAPVLGELAISPSSERPLVWFMAVTGLLAGREHSVSLSRPHLIDQTWEKRAQTSLHIVDDDATRNTDAVFFFWKNWSEYLCLVSFIFKIYLFKRQTKRERETKNNLPFAGLYSQKPKAKNSIQVSLMGGRDPSTWTVFCCFTSALAGSWIKNGGHEI